MGSPFEAMIKKQTRRAASPPVACRAVAAEAAAYRTLDVQPLADGNEAIVSLFSARHSIHAVGAIRDWRELVGSVVSVELLHDSPHRVPLVITHRVMGKDADAPWLEVPDPAWVDDEVAWRDLVSMVSKLRPPLQRLIHLVLRKEADLRAFLLVGASLHDHHADRGGLLRHTLECMQAVRDHGASRQVDLDLAIAGAALHDIGKCREYSGVGPGSRLTDSGSLLGHMLAGYRMVCEALALMELDEREELALLHCISASEAPDWVGLRRPRMTEAVLVNSCDRLSGRLEPLRPAPGQTGWYSPRTYRKQAFLALG